MDSTDTNDEDFLKETAAMLREFLVALKNDVGANEFRTALRASESTASRRISNKTGASGRRTYVEEFFGVLLSIKEKGLHTSDYLSKENKEKFFESGISFVNLQQYEDRSSFHDKLLSLEKEGRKIILSTFPSDLHIDGNNQSNNRRREQLTDTGIVCSEFYPISALINFGFSPSSPYACKKKIDILNSLDDFFLKSKDRSLYFFPDYKCQTVHSHTEMEILLGSNQIIIEAPGFRNTLITIENPLITARLHNEIIDNLNADITGLESKNVIDTLIECLKNGDDAASLINFVKKCFANNRKVGIELYNHLSPTIQQQVDPNSFE